MNKKEVYKKEKLKIVVLEYVRRYIVVFIHNLEKENYKVHENNLFYFEMSASLQ